MEENLKKENMIFGIAQFVIKIKMTTQKDKKLELEVKIQTIELTIQSAKNYLWYLRFEKYPILKYLFHFKWYWTQLVNKTDLEIIKSSTQAMEILNKN